MRPCLITYLRNLNMCTLFVYISIRKIYVTPSKECFLIVRSCLPNRFKYAEFNTDFFVAYWNCIHMHSCNMFRFVSSTLHLAKLLTLSNKIIFSLLTLNCQTSHVLNVSIIHFLIRLTNVFHYTEQYDTRNVNYSSWQYPIPIILMTANFLYIHISVHYSKNAVKRCSDLIVEREIDTF